MNNILYILGQPQFYLPILIWTLVWKGAALWKAATKRQFIWFILLLIVNTLGFFEIIYIFFFSRWDIDNGRILAFLSKKFKKSKK